MELESPISNASRNERVSIGQEYHSIAVDAAQLLPDTYIERGRVWDMTLFFGHKISSIMSRLHDEHSLFLIRSVRVTCSDTCHLVSVYVPGIKDQDGGKDSEAVLGEYFEPVNHQTVEWMLWHPYLTDIEAPRECYPSVSLRLTNDMNFNAAVGQLVVTFTYVLVSGCHTTQECKSAMDMLLRTGARCTPRSAAAYLVDGRLFYGSSNTRSFCRRTDGCECCDHPLISLMKRHTLKEGFGSLKLTEKATTVVRHTHDVGHSCDITDNFLCTPMDRAKGVRRVFGDRVAFDSINCYHPSDITGNRFIYNTGPRSAVVRHLPDSYPGEGLSNFWRKACPDEFGLRRERPPLEYRKSDFLLRSLKDWIDRKAYPSAVFVKNKEQ